MQGTRGRIDTAAAREEFHRGLMLARRAAEEGRFESAARYAETAAEKLRRHHEMPGEEDD
jgi:HEPN domain-containing protein